MTPAEFEDVLNSAVARMNQAAKAGLTGYADADQFETTVMGELRMALGGALGARSAERLSAFPDILVNGFGVEVKFTKQRSWLGTGNSIFETHRAADARDIYLVFCRADIPEVRWRRYEDCISGVRISHSPRYMLDMGGENAFFSDLGMTLDDFRAIDLRDKMALVRDHVKTRLKPGERLWWIDETQEHTLPVQVRLYRLLDSQTKARMRAEAALMCPQIFQHSRQRGKYDAAALYLLTQHGVFAPQTRDLFSAGSVAGASRGGDYLIRSIRGNQKEIEAAALRLDDALFVEYWGESCDRAKRMGRWLALIDNYRPDDPPSRRLGFV